MTDIFRKEYKKLEPDDIKYIGMIKDRAEALYEVLQLMQNRETSIAKTKLEEAVMWAIKGATAG